ncbi:hypothetical protein DMENIID0001_039160 [Sergentomyia squamirostris]
MLLTLSSVSRGKMTVYTRTSPAFCTLSLVYFPSQNSVREKERDSLATMKLWQPERERVHIMLAKGGNLSSQDTSSVLIRPSEQVLT